MRCSRMKGRNARWKTEAQRRFEITVQRCWEKNMDNFTVLGLVPAYVLSQCLELEANKHQKEPACWLCSLGWNGSHHSQCQHGPCLTLIANLWCLWGISSHSPHLLFGSPFSPLVLPLGGLCSGPKGIRAPSQILLCCHIYRDSNRFLPGPAFTPKLFFWLT